MTTLHAKRAALNAITSRGRSTRIYISNEVDGKLHITTENGTYYCKVNDMLKVLKGLIAENGGTDEPEGNYQECTDKTKGL